MADRHSINLSLSPAPFSETQIRRELLDLAEEASRLGDRLRDLHRRLPIPPRDDLMLLGEEDPVFSHTARVHLECLLADPIEHLVRDLRAVAEEQSSCPNRS